MPRAGPQAARRKPRSSEAPDAEEGVEEATLTPERYAAAGRARTIRADRVGQTGFGKRSSSYEYRVTGRGGSGIVAIGMGKKNSAVIAAFPVEESDDLMLISDAGQTIRVAVAGISIQGRAAQGVTVFRRGRRRDAWCRSSASPMSAAANEPQNSCIGLYPGTFDPVTLGHLDIIKRAVKLVDHLVIGVATNASKSSAVHARGTGGDGGAGSRQRWRTATPPSRCSPSTCLLVNFAAEVGASVIIRGLRAVSDFEYEFQMVAMNQRLNTEIETVFLMADPRHQAISSRLVKEIALLGGDVAPFTTPRGGRGSRQTLQGTEVMAHDPENTLILELKNGPVKIALRPDLAPDHVDAHQGTDRARASMTAWCSTASFPASWPRPAIPPAPARAARTCPISRRNSPSEKHKRGTVSAARTANPNSANSQFFICFDDAPWLDRQYSVWGEVVEGMDHVDAIKKGGEHNNGAISGEPDKILKARIEADAT